MIDATVAELMRRDVRTVTPDTGVGELAVLLSDEGLSSVPVVEGGKLVGVVGQADLIFQEIEDEIEMPHTLPIFGAVVFLEPISRWRERFRRAFGTTVGDLMTAEPVTALPGDSVHEAARRMIDSNVNRVPVVDEGGAVVGVISRADIVRALALEW